MSLPKIVWADGMLVAIEPVFDFQGDEDFYNTFTQLSGFLF
jgi:hypothetical protein